MRHCQKIFIKAFSIITLLLILAGCGGSSNGNNNGIDATPPNLSNGAPSGVLPSSTTESVLSVTTDADAICKYATASGVDYSTMANTFSTSGGSTHSTDISGFSDGQTYNYYIRCQDGAGNVNTNDYLIAFAVTRVGDAYYVSPTGNTTWLQCANINTPCSWQTATSNALAGDVVYFRGGTYDPGPGPDAFGTPVMNPSNSGMQGNPIIFTGYPGETATILEGSGSGLSGTNPSIGAVNRQWIIWDGFTLIRDKDTGYGASSIVKFDMCNNCTLKNSDIIGVTPHMDHTNGVLISVLNSSYVTIYNNKLHGMVADANPVEPVMNTGAMWIFNDDHIYVYNNDIYDVQNGIQSKAGPSYFYAYNNHIWDCSRSAFNIIPQTTGATDYIFYQNVIRDCNTALYSPDPARVFYNLRFYNNSIYNSGAGTLAIIGKPGYSDNHRNAEIYNNIISNNGGNSLFVRYMQGLAFPVFADHNNFYGAGYWNFDYVTDYYSIGNWRTATGVDLNSITSNPSFVTPGGTNPDDYKLQVGSFAINAGIDRQDYDNDGNTTESINMGAYITGTETIGVDY